MPTEEELQQQQQSQFTPEEPENSYTYNNPENDTAFSAFGPTANIYPSEESYQQNAQANSYRPNVLNSYNSPDIASLTGGNPWGPGSYAFDRWRKPYTNWPHNKPSLNKWRKNNLKYPIKKTPAYNLGMHPSQAIHAKTALAKEIQKRTYDSYFELIETPLKNFLSYSFGILTTYSTDPNDLLDALSEITHQIEKLPYASVVDSGEHPIYSFKVRLKKFKFVLFNDKGDELPFQSEDLQPTITDPNFIWGFTLPSYEDTGSSTTYDVNIDSTKYIVNDDGTIDTPNPYTFNLKIAIYIELCIVELQ